MSTFQPERGEMRRVRATSRACPSRESTVYIPLTFRAIGGVAERSNAAVSKTVIRR